MKKKLLTALGVVIPLVFLISPFLIKVQIRCKSQFGECPTDIKDKLSKFNSKSLFSARHSAYKLLNQDFLVSNFTSQFQLPNILEISLLIKKPIFAITDKSTGNTGLVDIHGQILSLSNPGSLPNVIVPSTQISVGGHVSDRELFALKLLQGLFEMYQVDKGEIADDSLTVELPGPITVIFPLSGDIQVLLGETRLTYGKVETTDLAGKYRQIDLRFRNPVLRY